MLDRIRNAPRATRQRWFWALTIAAAIVLVLLWVQYLSWNLHTASAGSDGSTGNELTQGFNPVQSLKGFAASIYDAIDASRPHNRAHQAR